MTGTPPILHMLCGKIAAGKSTLAGRLAQAENTVRISEDAWLGALYPEELKTPKDYARFAERLRGIMGVHVTALLQSGVSVVMDYPANTIDNRNWMRRIFEEADADHRLHVLRISDDIALERLRKRNAGGNHPFEATEAQFRLFAKHYQAPTPNEGFKTVIHHAPD